MNADGGPTASSSAGPPTPTSQRKERGAIAAQACDNCRQRKQRCSEERPKCATCQRMGLECKYREPQPTKKDKTMVEILDRVKLIQDSLKDNNAVYEVLGVVKSVQRYLLDGQGEDASIQGTAAAASGPDPLAHAHVERSSPWPSTHTHGSSSQPSAAAAAPTSTLQYRYASAAHKVLLWPCVQRLLEAAPSVMPRFDVLELERNGSKVLWSFHDDATPEPMNVEGSAGAISFSGSSQEDDGDSSAISLDWDTLQRLSKAFFDSFNLIYPLIDRQAIQNTVLPSVATNGLDNSSESTLVCLILALGQVAIAGSQSSPMGTHKGRPSGIKGPLLQSKPSFFSEFQKRLGFVLSDSTLECVQILSLAAIYYETCCRHHEFWVMSMHASLACQALLISNPEVLQSDRGDLVKRAFWHCSMVESGLHLELDLPVSGLDKFEGLVGLPDFGGEFAPEDYDGNATSHYQQHFATQIVLRRLSVSFNSSMLAVGSSSQAAVAMLQQLALQLDQWKGMLPNNLRWHEEHPNTSNYPLQSQGLQGQGLYVPSVLSSNVGSMNTSMFSASVDLPQATYTYATEIQTAFLRTRYLHLKYHLCRPFVFKALHHPEEITQDDANGVVECFKVMLNWPIVMSPVCHNKRMVPNLFIWSQNLLSILLILHLSRQVPILARIRSTMLNETFDANAHATEQLYLDWIRDLKDYDPTALWCWSVLKLFYPLDDQSM